MLKLSWDSPEDPLRLADFESQARSKRYESLGRACRFFRIESLLLAHHADDQAETVLLRLLAGRTGVGLRGIRSIAHIPECEGMHGVHESGSHVTSRTANPSFSYLRNPDNSMRIPMAKGGVHVHRPLLSFKKERLIETCLEANVPWHDDPTNMDMTLTTRNTVRHMWNHELLPRALDRKTLLRLASLTSDAVQRLETHAMNLLEKTPVSLDPRSGVLILRLYTQSINNYFKEKSFSRLKVLYILALLIRVISSSVSPLSRCPTYSMIASVPFILSEIYDIPRIASTSALKTRTVAGVAWARVPDTKLLPHEPTQWTLSRQQHQSNTILPYCEWSESRGAPFWSWQLFDGRFWMRVRHRTNRTKGIPVLARPLRRGDLKELRLGLTQSQRKTLDIDLSNSAPGKIRWTLPALVDAHSDLILALPTFGVSVNMNVADIEWQTQYRYSPMLEANEKCGTA